MELQVGQVATRSLEATAEVLSRHATRPVTQLGVRITRQDGEVVLEGEAWCYTMLPADPADSGE